MIAVGMSDKCPLNPTREDQYKNLPPGSTDLPDERLKVLPFIAHITAKNEAILTFVKKKDFSFRMILKETTIVIFIVMAPYSLHAN